MATSFQYDVIEEFLPKIPGIRTLVFVVAHKSASNKIRKAVRSDVRGREGRRERVKESGAGKAIESETKG